MPYRSFHARDGALLNEIRLGSILNYSFCQDFWVSRMPYRSFYVRDCALQNEIRLGSIRIYSFC